MERLDGEGLDVVPHEKVSLPESHLFDFTPFSCYTHANMKHNFRVHVVGIDGGGTKTVAELLSSDGVVHATARGGPSNFQVRGTETSARTIGDLVETCCHSAGISPREISAVVAGLTGAGRRGDQLRMKKALSSALRLRGFTRARIDIESDARIALEAAFGGRPGIAIIAGTGSIVMGKDARGRIHRAGGWGRYLGDEGSGYTISREALRAVAKMTDGAGKPTALARRFAKKFGLVSQEAIINAVYKNGFDIPSLAPLIIAAAVNGDAVARNILSDATTELLGVTTAVWRKVRASGERIPVAFIGSLIANDNFYSRKLRAKITRELRGTEVQAPESQPAHGASIMALGMLRMSSSSK